MQEQDLRPPSSKDTSTDGERRSGRMARFLSLMIELVLVTIVAYQFQIERERYFFPVLLLIVCGFAIHAWLPRHDRLGFFAFLSVGSVLFVLGVGNGLSALGIGGALIGLCYLPIGYTGRLIVLALVAGLLVLLRFHYPLPIWPVLGSMFMFRLMIFFYECRKATEKPTLAMAVAYFFMVPNVCFPLFPVVDYKTFVDCWMNEDEFEIYQRGVTWIVRGLIHLLLYRFINAYLVPASYEIGDVPHLAQFMAMNYALYLQVSGQFHLITGLLHLFGFNLPRTHDLYFLASSFSDIWRRINIYWTNFLRKFFFLPAFHAARARGTTVGPAIVLGVFCAFVATWLLHSWQTFWLLGRFPVTFNDAALWLGAGTCVAINSLLELRRRPSVKDRPAWFVAFQISLQTVGMFLLISLFWSFWTTPGFLRVLINAFNQPDVGWGLFVVILWMMAAATAMTVIRLLGKESFLTATTNRAITFRESVQIHVAGLGLLIAVSSPSFGRLLGPDAAQNIAAFRNNAVPGSDVENRVRSYYEDLNTAAIQAGPLIQSLVPEDETRRAQAQGYEKVSRPADIYQEVDLIPNISVDLGGSRFSVNQYNMRDRASLTQTKSPNATRIALLGSSVVMGFGVSDDEVFARRFEDDLNMRQATPTMRFEVLNFGVGKQWASHRLVRLQRHVVTFEPDAVYYFAHQDEFAQLPNHLAKLLSQQKKLPSKQLVEVVRKIGITQAMAWGAIQAHLERRQPELLLAVYQSIVDECRRHEAVPVYVYLPIPGQATNEIGSEFLTLAETAGFVVCDLSDWAADRRPDELFSPEEKVHPNALGHRLIADSLARMVATYPQTLPVSATTR